MAQLDVFVKQAYPATISRRHAVLKILDIAVLFLLWGAVMGLSVLSVLRMIQGRKVAYYGQLSLIPEGWRHWLLGEKPKRQATGK